MKEKFVGNTAGRENPVNGEAVRAGPDAVKQLTSTLLEKKKKLNSALGLRIAKFSPICHATLCI
eukprot:12928504-Prorocentrum_lima.AAC.1